MLRGIVRRMTSAEWWLGPPDHSAYPNQWVPLSENGARDWTRKPVPLTAAELGAIYGSVTTEETETKEDNDATETPRLSALAEAVRRSRGGPPTPKLGGFA